MEDIAGDDYDVIVPYKFNSSILPGSTDVGDVSWIVPTGQAITTTCAFGTPVHSWQMVSQGKSGIAHKGMILAAKALAGAAIDMIENPEKIQAAKEEHIENLVKYGILDNYRMSYKPICDIINERKKENVHA